MSDKELLDLTARSVLHLLQQVIDVAIYLNKGCEDVVRRAEDWADEIEEALNRRGRGEGNGRK